MYVCMCVCVCVCIYIYVCKPPRANPSILRPEFQAKIPRDDHVDYVPSARMILREVFILIFQSISGRKALYRTKLHFFGSHGARPHTH